MERGEFTGDDSVAEGGFGDGRGRKGVSCGEKGGSPVKRGGRVKIKLIKQEKQLTGWEMREMILRKNEEREMKKTKREGQKMVKQGKIRTLFSYYK